MTTGDDLANVARLAARVRELKAKTKAATAELNAEIVRMDTARTTDADGNEVRVYKQRDIEEAVGVRRDWIGKLVRRHKQSAPDR